MVFLPTSTFTMEINQMLQFPKLEVFSTHTVNTSNNCYTLSYRNRLKSPSNVQSDSFDKGWLSIEKKGCIVYSTFANIYIYTHIIYTYMPEIL